MSSTRYAEEGSPLRQERYASDPAFMDFLKASSVSRKCRLFDNPLHKEICLYLQHMSMQPGGLAALVSDFLQRYSDRIGSQTMRENSRKNIFDADLVRAVREELNARCTFPLKGEMDTIDPFGAEITQAERLDREEYTGTEYQDAERLRQAQEADQFPRNYPAAAFADYCLSRAEDGLEDWLTSFCLDPETLLTDPPRWFPALERSLMEYMADRAEDELMGKVVTSIGEQINDALDYAWEEKCMVHINGVARMGKTFQVEQWCRCHPGRVRYIQVPSSNDDTSFFRAIARAIGTNSGSSMNLTQMKRQVEDTIQDAGMMLIFDEAHYLIPAQKRGSSYPRRINWVLTEIVNKGIPVAIVTTPQFDTNQALVVNNTGWASEQLDGRIAYRLDLPPRLPESDLAAIAKHHLPNADKQSVGIICEYSRYSCKYLAGIDAVAKRARFLAKKSGRNDPDKSDIKTAALEVDPSISKQLESEEKKPECNRSAKPVKRSRRSVAEAVQAAEKQLVGAD